MKKTNCPNLAKNLIILLILSLVFAVLFSGSIYALSSDNINLQGKIVRNDIGHEGLNVIPGSPACVVNGPSNDTCDFRVSYYTALTGGTLLLTEDFTNVEIGQFDGVFELSLGSGTVTTTLQCRDGTCNSPSEVISEYGDLYVELQFAPDGSTLTETFTRMPLEASPYAIFSKFAEGAHDAFKLSTSVSNESLENPSAGMIYFDTGSSQLKVYNGAEWQALSAGTSSSLWTDAGTYSYLTSTTDDLVLGGSSFSTGRFVFDMDGGSGSYFDVFNNDHSNKLFTILNSGNVGIGTATPGAKLEVGGTASTITNSTGNLTISTGGGNGNILLMPNGTGKVGIGTTSPGVKLDVAGQGRFESTVYPVVDIIRDTGSAGGGIYGGARLQRKTTSPTSGGGIGFFFWYPNSNGVLEETGMFGGALADTTAGSEIGEIIFGASYHGVDPYTQRHLIIRAVNSSQGEVRTPYRLKIGADSSPSQALDVTGNAIISGNVGIGITNPTHKLELASHTTASGGIGFGTDVELYRSNTNTLSLASGDNFNLVSGNVQIGSTTILTSGRLVQAANGSVSSPAFSFSSDTNTGMYGTGSDTLSLVTNGTDRITINASGNVGIGTTSPTAYLHLKAGTTSANTAPLKFTTGANLATPESGAMEWDGSRLYITNITPTRNTIAYLSDLSSFITQGYQTVQEEGSSLTQRSILNFIGSGITAVDDSPNSRTNITLDTKLNAFADLVSSAGVLTNNGSGGLSWVNLNSGDELLPVGTEGQMLYNNAGVWTSFSGMYWDDTNNRLGIGTTTPSEKLEIVGRLKMDDETMETTSVTFDGDTTAGLKLSNPRGYITLTPLNTGWAHIYTDRSNFIFDKPVYSYANVFSSYNNDLQLRRAGTTEVVIGSTRTTITDNLSVNGTSYNYFSGNIGIGTTSPTAYLHLKAGTSSANTAPLKFTTGANLATPESGAMEWDGSRLYITNTTPTRNTIAYLTDIVADTDNYVDSVSFNTGDGVLTLGRTGTLPDLTTDLDGRYLQTEADTLQSVTNRGATTTVSSSFTGGATIRGLIVDDATATHDRILTTVASVGTARYDGTLTNADLTAARTWTLPDKSGTVAMTSDIPVSDNYQYWVLQANGAAGSNITSTSAVSFNGSGIVTTSRSGNTITITGTEADPIWSAAEPSYFNLTQNETVTGIPAFNGGTTGSTAPFNVDSTYVVANLNSDLLDGYHANNLPYLPTGTDNWVNTTGDTMTGSLTFSGVSSDITTVNNEHLSLMPNGTGKVGIGTTSPGYPLDVSGNARVTGTLYVDALYDKDYSDNRVFFPAVQQVAIGGGVYNLNVRNEVTGTQLTLTGGDTGNVNAVTKIKMLNNTVSLSHPGYSYQWAGIDLGLNVNLQGTLGNYPQNVSIFKAAITVTNDLVGGKRRFTDFSKDGVDKHWIDFSGNTYFAGNMGIGVVSPTAYFNLKAGTATAGTAPLKFTAGTNLTAAESGAMEWDGSRLYITNTTPTRNTIAYLTDIVADTDNYVDSVSFNTGDGVLTLGRTGTLPDLTTDLDGRYLQTEADTLQSVTNRGATTTVSSSFTGGATIRGLIVDDATATHDRILTTVASVGTARYDGTLTNADLTAARTWTLPDKSGTVAMTSDIPVSDNYQYWVLQANGAAGSNITSTSAVSFNGSGIVTTSRSGNTITITGTEADPIWSAAEPSYFNLTQNETVTGIPAFNGGTTGSTAPFNVDSTYVVANLNSDLLDGYHANNLPYLPTGTDNWVNTTGDTMTGSLTFSGVSSDITTVNNEHLSLMPNGTGKVGIGTTSPIAALQIDAPNGVTGLLINGGTTDNVDLLKMVGNANTQRLILQRTGGATTFLEAGGSIGLFGTSSNHDFRIRTNYIDRLSITTSGNVGIGTTSPSSKLVVNTGGYSTIKLQYNGTSVVDIFSNVSSNIFIGLDSGSVITSGTGNVALGDNALSATTIGTSNTAIGYFALDSNVAKQGSTAIGYQAMMYADNTTTQGLSYNTAVGYQALVGSPAPSSNTGMYNTVVGHQSMTVNTTGSYNSALGVNTLINNTIGQYNVAVGYGALFTNVAKNASIAIGYEAMRYADNTTTTGTSGNIAVGYQALKGSTTASNNTGTNNIALGYQSLYGNTSGYDNVSIGSYAGNAITTGSNNSLFGYSAGSNLTTGSNNIIIGANINADSATGSNQLNIGGAIKGDLSTGDVSITRNLGINGVAYTWPNAQGSGLLTNNGSGGLSWNTSADLGLVSGTGSAGQVSYWSGTNSITGSDSFWWDSTNNRLGIGTNTPNASLDVAGSISGGSNSKSLAENNFTFGNGGAVDGELDESFPVKMNGANEVVYALAIQSDGKIIIGGSFSTYNGTGRNRIARINSDGSLDTTFNPGTGANSSVFALAIQSDGKIIIGGSFSTYNGTGRNRIARINSDGSLDTTFNPGTGADNEVYALAIQSDGKIIIGGWFTTYNGTGGSRIARINSDGSLDTTFNPGTGANSAVSAIAIQSDGKIIIGGSFSTYNGTGRNRIARINSDGSLDTTFNPGTGANSSVYALAIQSDGKIIIGGSFTAYNGTGRNRIARINSDGSLDTTFNPGTGANSGVSALAIQGDGKIIIGGYFSKYNGTGRNRIARINSDGSLDTTFNPGTGADNEVSALAIQSDGKIIIGGWFSTYNGTGRNNIARINSDGSLDTTFNPGTGADGEVSALAIQSDGKIIIGGSFSTYNGTGRNRIARINSDGSLDTTFNPGTGVGGSISALAIQSDGKIIIGGNFTTYNGTGRNRIARINSDGSLDTTFNPGTGANSGVSAIAIQSDGKIIIGGWFSTYNGTGRNRIARINSDGSLDTTFNPGTGADNEVSALAIQSDGKIIIGGWFSTYNGTGRNRIARINSDGSLDTTFNPGTGANGSVSALAIQGDGKIIIGGWFSTYNGTGRNRIARINSDGSLDTTFNPGTGANSAVSAIAIQSDGKIIIGGEFTAYNGRGRNRIARVNSNGSLDTTFNPGTGADNEVSAIAIQSDGKIVISGNFTTYNDNSRGYIARLLVSVLYNPYANSFLVGFGSSRMFIDNTRVNFLGNSVGINLADPLSPPSAMLAVRGITSDSTAAALKVTNLSDNSLLFVRNDGNVGIGVDTPTYRLQLPNTASAAGQGQANAWVTYSDISLKENIQTISGGLDKIMALRGVTFDWKGQGVASSGFIAQEVESIIPDLVSTDSNGLKSLDYGRFTPYLVEAIKEQQLQIQTAYNRIEQLENINENKIRSITTPGWYRISKLDTNDDHSNIKINNTSVGSSQNIVLSIDSTLNNQNINVVSNLTTGEYDITKARINNKNGIKYLEIYIPEVNGNKISVKITESSNWIATDIVQITEEVNNAQEYALSGILFGISDKLEVEEDNVKIAGDLLSLSVNSSIGDSANRWNDIYAKGTIRIGSGTDGEGAIRFNVQTKTLEFSNNGVEWLSVGDLSSQMTISPEYAGAILFADGSDNSGIMTSDAVEESGSFKNYYEWVSNKDTPQDYDILVRITLPTDFLSWKEDAIYLDFMTENSVSTDNNSVGLSIIGNSGTDVQISGGISKIAGAWERMSIKGADITQCNSAGGTCTLRISLTSSMEYFTRVGDITLNYNRSL